MSPSPHRPRASQGGHLGLPGLEALIPADRILHRPVDLVPYESDALTAFRQRPRAVVVPHDRDEVIALVRWCHQEGVPFVARGSGTSLSGGSLPVAEGIVLALNRLDRILDLDPVAARARVEPGVINLAVSQAAAPHGLYYAPDPSSQSICTLGGNIAFNSGGAHCLKHGMTSNHVLGLEVVLADGTVTRLGSPALEGVGPDLPGLVVGSEGLFGVVLEATLRLLPQPQRFHTVLAAYDDLGASGEAVAKILGAGLLPGALEIMDALAIEAAEAAVDAGYPKAGGLLIVELEGERHQVAAEAEILTEVLAQTHPFEVRIARDAAERVRIWKGRKGAFSAVGRLSPDYLVQDGVVPRTRLGEALTTIETLSAEHGLRVANVFHAGDGNLHPLILYDGRRPGELERAETLAAEILRLCIRLGGSITGEHGIGVEKREFLGELFSPTDLDVQHRLCQAMDPAGLANPGKGFPLGWRDPVESAQSTPPSSLPVPDSGIRGLTEGTAWTPRDEAELAVGVAEAGARGLRLRCRGGRSKPLLSSPWADEVVVDCSAIEGIVEHDPAELTITVAAGTPIARVQQRLAEHGQFLPFEPPLAGCGATVGGTVATALSGAGRLRHGGVRDYLLGIRWVDGRGARVRGGGRVVKNAAGLDLPKLLVGSLGRLGVLTEATFKVFPRPPAEAVLRARLNASTRPATDLAAVLQGLPQDLELDAVEGVLPAADREAEVWVRLRGLEPALPPRVQAVRQRLQELPEVAVVETLAANPPDSPWACLEAAPGWVGLARIPLPPGGLATLEPELKKLADAGCWQLASAAGAFLWLGWETHQTVGLEPLSAALARQGWRGLLLRSPDPTPPILGQPLGGPMGDRVTQTLDPFGVFARGF